MRLFCKVKSNYGQCSLSHILETSRQAHWCLFVPCLLCCYPVFSSLFTDHTQHFHSIIIIWIFIFQISWNPSCDITFSLVLWDVWDPLLPWIPFHTSKPHKMYPHPLPLRRTPTGDNNYQHRIDLNEWSIYRDTNMHTDIHTQDTHMHAHTHTHTHTNTHHHNWMFFIHICSHYGWSCSGLKVVAPNSMLTAPTAPT